MNSSGFSQIVQIGTGAAFILFPLIFIFAFSAHPGLLRPRLLKAEEIIRRARRNNFLQFGHVLVLLNTALLVMTAIYFVKLSIQSGAGWAGAAGGALAILGAIFLAADKGAFCLTMSALDTVPEDKFSAMMPGLLAIFSKKGWMVLLWGIVLLPLGFAIQVLGLMQAGMLPLWQGGLFLAGVMLVATPDGLEIVNLSASVMMAAAFVPYGIQLIIAAV
jgi:hypothetical protein